MIYHMQGLAQNVIDRSSLARASSILDMLAIGWRPGEAELNAPYVEQWAIMPRSNGLPYNMIGITWSLPVKQTVMVAAVLAIDRAAHWARVWDEWIVIGDPLGGTPAVEDGEISRAGAAWLLSEVQRLPAS